MTTLTTHRMQTLDSSHAPRWFRRIVAGAVPFDAVMGAVCLAAAPTIGSWLSVDAGWVCVTGVSFAAAALAGVWTLRRPVPEVRAIVAANVLFAVCCLLVLGVGGPNLVGIALLIASAVAAAATAVAEHVLGAAGDRD